MKRITYFPLTHHYFKYAGLLMSLVGLGLALFKDPRFELLLYTGLLVVAYSRERNESATTQQIRSEVFVFTESGQGRLFKPLQRFPHHCEEVLFNSTGNDGIFFRQ